MKNMQMPGGRLFGRLFCFAFFVAGLIAGNASAQGFPKTTLVQDVVYRADGTTATGSLVITWPAFLTADGAAVAAGTKTVQLGSDGSFSVALAPNVGGIPSGTYYSVTLKLDSGMTSKETWLVPVTSPAKLAAVRAAIAPATLAVQALTSDWANANLVNLGGAQSISGAKSFSVAPSVPTPVNPTDAANKQYVDANAGGAGPNVARTNMANVWSQPQTFPSLVEQDVKSYPVTAFGAVSGQDVTQAMNSVDALIPSKTGGTMVLPNGQWNRSTTFTPAAGLFNMFGEDDGRYQFQSVLNFTQTDGTPGISVNGSGYTTAQSLHLKGFQINGNPKMGDCISINSFPGANFAIDDMTVLNCGGAAIHLKNSFINRLISPYAQYNSYGLFLDGASETQVIDGQFAESSIASVNLGGSVANNIFADYSDLKSGGTAAIVATGGEQDNYLSGYFENGTANYSQSVLASFATNTISQDLSHLWASDIANQCMDLGYNNICPKGQGYWGSWNAISYTNLWPNSSITAPNVTGFGLAFVNFGHAQDTSTNAALTARGSSLKLNFTGTANTNGYLELPYTFQAGHAYLFRALVWTDQPYYRTNQQDTGKTWIEMSFAASTGTFFPSGVTGFYADNVPREECLIGVAAGNVSGSGSVNLLMVNGQSSANTLWVTDVTFADVTSMHGINLCGLPYAQTFGSVPATYSAAAPRTLQSNAVLGSSTYLSDDATSTAGTLLVGNATGSFNGTGQVGEAQNPIGKIYGNAINATGTLAVTGVSQLAGNSAYVPADFTTANSTGLQAIAGLAFNLPATAYGWKYHCALAYSQSTGNAAVGFGIQAATANPNNIFGIGEEQIAAGPPSTSARGVLTTVSNTSAATIVSATPGATGTNYTVMLDGTIENPAAANTINFLVSTANGADAVTVKRGSECEIW